MAVPIRTLANAIRALAMDAVEAANSGHPGMPMGMADVATILWTEYLKHDPADPKWPDRDRFVLSAGHGSMLIYALLHLTGYERPTIDDIRNFRQLGSPCAGHPENFLLDGVEATTGPLGQGVAMAVGMAIAERHLNAPFGDDLVDHRTWAIAGDGCLMEGVNHEAAGLAGHLGARPAERAVGRQPHHHRRRHRPFHLRGCRGALPRLWLARGALRRAGCGQHPRGAGRGGRRPASELIACRTIIGFGAPNKQGTAATHGSALGAEEVAAARRELGWDYPPFEIPAEILSAWRTAGRRGQAVHRDWTQRLQGSAQAGEFMRRMAGELPADFSLGDYLSGLIAARKRSRPARPRSWRSARSTICCPRRSAARPI